MILTRVAPAAVLLLLLCLEDLAGRAHSFPLIAELDEEDTTCFKYNIPQDDDAHMVFVALPNHVEDPLEDWFVSHVNDMTRKGGENFMRDMPAMPPEISKSVESSRNQRSGIYLKVQKERRPIIRNEMFRWYQPIVMSNVVASAKRQGHGWEHPLGGYSICFENTNDSEARVLLDVVLVSDRGEDSNKKKKREVISKEHLTPLEESFQDGITAAHQILNEMHYMERREQRMKKTADSTNARIRYFSYISVGALLGVTWMQVMYLRSYFKKKKLL